MAWLALLVGAATPGNAASTARRDVLERGKPRQQRVVLKHDRRARADPVTGFAADASLRRRRAAIRPASDAACSVDLPQPMEPTIDDKLAFLDRQVDVAQHVALPAGRVANDLGQSELRRMPSMHATRMSSPNEARFDKAHQAVEQRSRRRRW